MLILDYLRPVIVLRYVDIKEHYEGWSESKLTLHKICESNNVLYIRKITLIIVRNIV
jgi:hypothetical protein